MKTIHLITGDVLLNILSKIYLVIILIIFCVFSAQSKDKIVFTCALDGSMVLWEKVMSLYQQAFNDLGYEFEMQKVSRGRALLSLKTHFSDGECGRKANLHQTSFGKNLVLIDVPIFKANIGVWTLKKNIDLHTFKQDIKTNDAILGLTRGSLKINEFYQKLMTTNIYEVNTTKQGVQMLLSNRIDYFSEFDAQAIFHLNEYDTNNKVNFIGNVISYHYYPFISKKYEHLAPPLTARLLELVTQRGGAFSAQDMFESIAEEQNVPLDKSKS